MEYSHTDRHCTVYSSAEICSTGIAQRQRKHSGRCSLGRMNDYEWRQESRVRVFRQKLSNVSNVERNGFGNWFVAKDVRKRRDPNSLRSLSRIVGNSPFPVAKRHVSPTQHISHTAMLVEASICVYFSTSLSSFFSIRRARYLASRYI